MVHEKIHDSLIQNNGNRILWATDRLRNEVSEDVFVKLKRKAR